ncbi:MAG: hypothetical protein QM754_04070 [Tepidisphaeraceae bacterium]
MAYLTLLLFLAVVLFAWCGTLVLFMAKNLLRPRRMTDERAFVRLKRTSPADLGLPFQPIGFTVRDQRDGRQIRLAAWWMPAAAPSSKTVVIAHGYGDAKVGGIAWAPTWRDEGWNVLAVDLRAHGESDGQDCTAGYFEREDLARLIDALRREARGDECRCALRRQSWCRVCVGDGGATRRHRGRGARVAVRRLPPSRARSRSADGVPAGGPDKRRLPCRRMAQRE